MNIPLHESIVKGRELLELTYRKFAAKGMSDKEIGELLGLTPKTIFDCIGYKPKVAVSKGSGKPRKKRTPQFSEDISTMIDDLLSSI